MCKQRTGDLPLFFLFPSFPFCCIFFLTISVLKPLGYSIVYLLLYLKWISNRDLLYIIGNSAQCYVAAWRWREFGGKWLHVYVWLSPFAVHMKLSQHCLSATLQYKIKKCFVFCFLKIHWERASKIKVWDSGMFNQRWTNQDSAKCNEEGIHLSWWFDPGNQRPVGSKRMSYRNVGFDQPYIENIQEKNPESSKKQSLDLPRCW